MANAHIDKLAKSLDDVDIELAALAIDDKRELPTSEQRTRSVMFLRVLIGRIKANQLERLKEMFE